MRDTTRGPEVTPELSVVVPVHNEAESVVPLLAEIGAALDRKVEFEVVYVDDGSDDGTGERLSTVAAEFARLRVVRHPRRAGQSAAILDGVRAAQGHWVATLDGDGQNDPADILTLLEALRDPAAGTDLRLVLGNRRVRQDSLIRRVSSRVANGVRARLLGDATPDTGCGLKLFSRQAFLALPHFDHMHRFLPALFQQRGWQTASVPVGHRPRLHGRSHYGVLDRLWAGIVDLAGVVWLKRRAIPAVIKEQSDES